MAYLYFVLICVLTTIPIKFFYRFYYWLMSQIYHEEFIKTTAIQSASYLTHFQITIRPVRLCMLSRSCILF